MDNNLLASLTHTFSTAALRQSGTGEESKAPELNFKLDDSYLTRADGSVIGAPQGEGVTGIIKGAWNDIVNAPSDAVNGVSRGIKSVGADLEQYSKIFTEAISQDAAKTVSSNLINGFADTAGVAEAAGAETAASIEAGSTAATEATGTLVTEEAATTAAGSEEAISSLLSFL